MCYVGKDVTLGRVLTSLYLIMASLICCALVSEKGPLRTVTPVLCQKYELRNIVLYSLSCLHSLVVNQQLASSVGAFVKAPAISSTQSILVEKVDISFKWRSLPI